MLSKIFTSAISKGKLQAPFVRYFAAEAKTSFGNLKDQDRIFTNLYGDGDPYINGALKRVLINSINGSPKSHDISLKSFYSKIYLMLRRRNERAISNHLNKWGP